MRRDENETRNGSSRSRLVYWKLFSFSSRPASLAPMHSANILLEQNLTKKTTKNRYIRPGMISLGSSLVVRVQIPVVTSHMLFLFAFLSVVYLLFDVLALSGGVC